MCWSREPYREKQCQPAEGIKKDDNYTPERHMERKREREIKRKGKEGTKTTAKR